MLMLSLLFLNRVYLLQLVMRSNQEFLMKWGLSKIHIPVAHLLNLLKNYVNWLFV